MAISLTDVDTLVLRAQQRDCQAFGELYSLYSRKVFNYLSYRLNGHSAEAEDLTADIFIKVYERIATYQSQGIPFSAWLFRVARNHLIDYLRGQPGQLPVGLDAAADITDPWSGREIDRRMTVDQLRHALVQLTAEQRNTVILRFIHGLSVAETATALDKSEDAVKKLQARGLLSLRRLLVTDRAGELKTQSAR